MARGADRDLLDFARNLQRELAVRLTECERGARAARLRGALMHAKLAVQALEAKRETTPRSDTVPML